MFELNRVLSISSHPFSLAKNDTVELFCLASAYNDKNETWDVKVIFISKQSFTTEVIRQSAMFQYEACVCEPLNCSKPEKPQCCGDDGLIYNAHCDYKEINQTDFAQQVIFPEVFPDIMLEFEGE